MLIELCESFAEKEAEEGGKGAVEFKRKAFDSDDDLDLENLDL